MGNSASSATVLKKEELEYFVSHTHFTSKEVQTMHKQFKKEIAQGRINRSEFCELMKGMGVIDEDLQLLVFGAFVDIEEEDSISFKGFIEALSVMSRGTAEEKMHFAFRMLDVDRKGEIERESLVKVTGSLFKIVGPVVTFSGRSFETPEAFVDHFYDQMELDPQQPITEEVYKAKAIKNPDIIQGLKLFDARMSIN